MLEGAAQDGTALVVVLMFLIVLVIVRQLRLLLAGVAVAVAMTAIAFAQLVDAQPLAVAARQADSRVHHEAHDHADHQLHAHDLQDGHRRHLLGQEDGQHLVGG